MSKKSYFFHKIRHAKSYLKYYWKWRKLSKWLKRVHPYCSICGCRKRLEVHHVLPRHLYPEKILDKDNLIVLCHECHFRFGHLGNWEMYNPNIDKYSVILLMQSDAYDKYRYYEEMEGRKPKNTPLKVL